MIDITLLVLEDLPPGELGSLLLGDETSLKSQEESRHLHSHLTGSQNVVSQSDGAWHLLVLFGGVGLPTVGSEEGQP